MTNPRKANGHRRRQVCARVKAEESDCWLCSRPVDKSLGIMAGQHSPRCRNPECDGCVYHPKSGVVDEIVPVSKGGSPYDRSNCRLAHRDCNRTRSNGDERTHTPPAPVTTSRDWRRVGGGPPCDPDGPFSA